MEDNNIKHGIRECIVSVLSFFSVVVLIATVCFVFYLGFKQGVVMPGTIFRENYPFFRNENFCEAQLQNFEDGDYILYNSYILDSRGFLILNFTKMVLDHKDNSVEHEVFLINVTSYYKNKEDLIPKIYIGDSFRLGKYGTEKEAMVHKKTKTPFEINGIQKTI